MEEVEQVGEASDSRTSRMAFSPALMVLAAAIFIRMAVALHPYSGAGKPPMFGDYEAQRHWMEITYHLPVKEWYVNGSSNDLLYWGLDYPPLTAYHSWVGGAIAARLNPDWVALNASRGYESYDHKLFMRYTVLVADVIVYFTAVLAFVCHVSRNSSHVSWSIDHVSWNIDHAVLAFLLLFQPGLILMDYGHFQYNCVSLGLALWGVVGVISNHDLLGAVAFSLALNYKQMELYHAIPFFCFLLGKALKLGGFRTLRKILALGFVVLLTFVICWGPFVLDKELALQVLRRVFPVDRGIYEDKVASVWCSLSLVVKLRQLLSQAMLLKLSLCTTLVAILPSALNLLCHPSPYHFVLALVNSSLAFFLFSFQVHEKSILLALLPASLLMVRHPHHVLWFSLVAAFSMYPLLVKDGLILATWALSGLFFTCSMSLVRVPAHLQEHWLVRAMRVCSMLVLLCLCVFSHVVAPPPSLPDLFPVLISSYSCLLFLSAFLHFNWLQLTALKHDTDHPCQLTATHALNPCQFSLSWSCSLDAIQDVNKLHKD